MKKVLQELTGSATSNDKLLIALSAVTKMFVGELVATGESCPVDEVCSCVFGASGFNSASLTDNKEQYCCCLSESGSTDGTFEASRCQDEGQTQT
jgi:hypothetical protein